MFQRRQLSNLQTACVLLQYQTDGLIIDAVVDYKMDVLTHVIRAVTPHTLGLNATVTEDGKEQTLHVVSNKRVLNIITDSIAKGSGDPADPHSHNTHRYKNIKFVIDIKCRLLNQLCPFQTSLKRKNSFLLIPSYFLKEYLPFRKGTQSKRITACFSCHPLVSCYLQHIIWENDGTVVVCPNY